MENGALFTRCDFDEGDEVGQVLYSRVLTLSDFVLSQKVTHTGESFLVLHRNIEEVAKGSRVENHCRLLQSCAAKFTHLFKLFSGAIAAQETLKAASGLYTPIRQFL
jgi:hypothetical protein